MTKIKKVRTSITIAPEVLEQVRATVAEPTSNYKSVAAFIELAIREKLPEILVAETADVREEDQSNG